MVARIRSGKSIKGAINYNEQKVEEGKAKLIHAKGYSKDPTQLNFHEKYQRLQRLADLNTRATTNCIHISLNFAPTEQLSSTTLQQIANQYMEKIGFKDQPWLVYEHHDAAHQHIHIVSTNIQKDGKRIALHNLGKEKSEIARKEIEINFSLVKAGAQQKNYTQQATAINAGKLEYGRRPTKQAISNVVTNVISQYKFASLHELNAILKLFNVIADRGAEGTRMFNKKGLQYAIIDANGNKIGVPIKASSINGKPTLAKLETMYAVNKEAKLAYRSMVRTKLNEAISISKNESTFQRKLKEKDIDVILRTNASNYLYGITYIDHQYKVIFNGSDLGKEYSAASVRERWAPQKETIAPRAMEPGALPGISPAESVATQQQKDTGLLHILTTSNNLYNELPYALKRKRKKRKQQQR